MVGVNRAQGQLMLGVVDTPLGARVFESLLNKVAMSAFDLARADGQVLA
jgi:hypothetical protein